MTRKEQLLQQRQKAQAQVQRSLLGKLQKVAKQDEKLIGMLDGEMATRAISPIRATTPSPRSSAIRTNRSFQAHQKEYAEREKAIEELIAATAAKLEELERACNEKQAALADMVDRETIYHDMKERFESEAVEAGVHGSRLRQVVTERMAELKKSSIPSEDAQGTDMTRKQIQLDEREKHLIEEEQGAIALREHLAALIDSQRLRSAELTEEVKRKQAELAAREAELAQAREDVVAKEKKLELRERIDRDQAKKVDAREAELLQREKQLHINERMLKENMRFRKKQIGQAVEFVADKEKEAQYVNTQVEALLADWRNTEAQLNELKGDQKTLMQTIEVLSNQYANLKRLFDGKRSDIDWMDRHLSSLLAAWRKFEDDARSAERLEMLNPATRDLLARCDIVATTLERNRNAWEAQLQRITTAQAAHVEIPEGLEERKQRIIELTAKNEELTQSVNELLETQAEYLQQREIVAEPDLSMMTGGKAILKPLLPTKSSRRHLSTLRTSGSQVRLSVPNDMAPPVFTKRKLGFHDNVLELKLQEIDQLLDTEVDYANRDGISAQSVVHSYRLIVLRQHDILRITAKLKAKAAALAKQEDEIHEIRHQLSNADMLLRADQRRVDDEMRVLHEKEMVIGDKYATLDQYTADVTAAKVQWSSQLEELKVKRAELAQSKGKLEEDVEFIKETVRKMSTLLDEKKAAVDEATQQLLATAQTHDATHKQLLEWERQCLTKQEELTSTTFTLEKVRDEMSAKETLIKKLDSDVMEVQQRLEEAQMSARKEQQTLQIRERELKAALAVIQGDLETLNAQYNLRKGELQTITDTLAKKAKEQGNIEGLLRFILSDLKEKQVELEATKKRHKDLMDQNAKEVDRVQNEIADLQKVKSAVQDSIRDLDKQKAIKQEELDQIARDIADQAETGKLAVTAKLEQSQSLQERQRQLKQSLEEMESKLDEKNKELTTISEVVTVHKREISSLEAIKSSLHTEGEAQGKQHADMINLRQKDVRDMDMQLNQKKKELENIKAMISIKQQDYEGLNTLVAMMLQERDELEKTPLPDPQDFARAQEEFRRMQQQMSLDHGPSPDGGSILGLDGAAAPTDRSSSAMGASGGKRVNFGPEGNDEFTTFIRTGDLDNTRTVTPKSGLRPADAGVLGINDIQDISNQQRPKREVQFQADDGGEGVGGSPAAAAGPEKSEDVIMQELDELEAYDYSSVHPGLLEEYARKLQEQLQEEKVAHLLTKNTLKRQQKVHLKLMIREKKATEALKALQAQAATSA
eukprot:TRINITY_DN8590_c0_g1_i1.p1 TRINITY_DN8590_c0_g1~~TRINITY_DN8590_c0_g1_i1.p1  ORF type:complete len:1488 (+),score=480.67 TRINITY_DN8590_c0_g1_i1:650-4465(+)